MKKHRFLSVLTALTVLTCGMTGYAASAAAKGSGDVDANGTVQIADAILLARWIAEDDDITVTTQGLANADMNGDDAVDSADAAELLCLLAGTNTAQPAEGRSVDLLEGYARGGGQTFDIEDPDAFPASQLEFTAKLVKELYSEDSSKNLLVSPASVALALGMTMNGAEGKTREEMRSLLAGDLTVDQFNSEYLIWQKAVQKRTNDAQLDLANAIWFRDDESRIIVPDIFRQTVADYYDASLYKAPFDDTTLEDVNGWVKDQTHGMIPDILKKVEPQHIMYLLNALAFEDEWKYQYGKDQISSDLFYSAEGYPYGVDMMHSDEYGYLESEKATGFLKYFKGDEKWGSSYAFAAILPNEDIPIGDYIRDLDGKELQKLLWNYQETNVLAAMPQFSFDWGSSLKPALEALGMSTAFSDAADFSGLNERATPENPTFIEDVIHKTFIDVGPQGVKAGAATLVIMADKGMPGGAKTVTLNRPFLFMIVDKVAGVPVFIGVVQQIGEEVSVPNTCEPETATTEPETTTTTQTTTEPIRWDCHLESSSRTTTSTMVYENPVIRTTAVAE